MALRMISCLLVLVLVLASPASTFTTTKFVEWFPRFEQALSPSWTRGPCKSIYNDFVYRGQGECGDVLNCILENTSELRKTTIASAQMVLGLTPPLLASIGSSVAEMSLVALERPLLSLLLVLGAPAMHQTRISACYVPLLDALETIPQAVGAAGEITTPSVQTVVLLAQYCIAAAAAANNLELALRIGSRSVLVWGCRSWYMPLFWIICSLSTYATATLICHMTIDKRKTDRPSPLRYHHHHHSDLDVQHAERESRRGCWSERLHCLQAPTHIQVLEKRPNPSTVVVLLQIFVSGLAFVQVVLGTLILSSLVFIGFHDTLIILARLVVSALACRAITLFQLMYMKESFAGRE